MMYFVALKHMEMNRFLNHTPVNEHVDIVGRELSVRVDEERHEYETAA